MKKLFAMLCLALFSQQSSAMPMDVPGYDFAAFAQFAGKSTGTFTAGGGFSTPPGITLETAIGDAEAATWVMDGEKSGDTQINMNPDAYIDLTFGTTDIFNGVGTDLSVFFVGAPTHTIGLTLFDGVSSSSALSYSNISYTGFNVDTDGLKPPLPGSGLSDPDWAIYVMDIDLNDFSSFLGTNPVDRIRLGIGNASAVPSFVGAYNTAPVPVPAAVWLFGSGLIGLVGVARRKK